MFIGFAWLAVVALFWSAVLARHLVRPGAPSAVATGTIMNRS